MKKIIRNWFGIWLTATLIFTALIIPSAPAAAATGTINLSANSGTVGTSVTVTGANFTSGNTYTVYFESAPVATGTVTSGNISTSFSVPDYPRGSHAVMVTTTGTSSDTSNTVYFTITTSIVLSTAAGPVGTSVTIAGHGFASGSYVSVYFDSTVVTNITSGTDGQFSGYLTIPATTAGNHTINAADSGGSSPNVTFTVTPLISLNPTTQTVGSNVVITGTGYRSSTTVSFYLDGAVISGMTATTNTAGGFTFNNYTVPVLIGGTHTITATDAYSNSNSVLLTVKQAIILSPVSGPTGTGVTITGNGFGASKPISVTYGGSGMITNPASVTTDTRGSFTAYFNVPTGYAGSYNVQASDGTLSASASFTVSGGASLSNGSGVVGSSVIVNGSNFVSNRTVVVRYDNIQVGTVLSSVSGAFTFSFKVPNSAGGSHSITCTDGVNTISLPFIVNASTSITETSATVGSDVAFTGSGFTASHAVLITFDNHPVSTLNTDTTGSFTVDIKIPASAGGNHVIAATDNVNTSAVSIAVKASVTASSLTGDVGSDVVITGSGFGAGLSCTLLWDNNILSATTTDSTGSFSSSVEIPAAARGLHVISVSDGANSVTLSYRVESAVTINPSSGNVGDNVTITGTGFAASAQVVMNYDSNKIGQTTSDANGSFTVVFKAPASRGGNHVVTVSDSIATVNVTFAMDSVPPPVPASLNPPDNSKAPARPKFTWSPETDPSGVTYTFQIATDPQFSDIIVNKTGLDNATYTLTKEESLKSVSKKSPYYWRVRAIDGASNASAWSVPQSFYVGYVMPTLVLYAIFAGALVLVFLIGFLLGRRRRSRV